MSKLASVFLLLASAWLAHAQTSVQAGMPFIEKKHYGTGLGKLLTTERERIKLDNLRFNYAPEPEKGVPMKAAVAKAAAPIAAPPQPWLIDGISHRPNRPPGQRISVWLDGIPYAESELPHGLSLVRNAAGEVMGLNSIVSKGKIEFAKIGDVITRPQTAEEAKAMALAAQKQELKEASVQAAKQAEKQAEKQGAKE